VVIAKKNAARLNELYFGILIHDLKSPLQCIVGAWDISKTYLPKTLTETQQRVVAAGDAGILQLKSMIDNMLSVAKFEAGTFPVVKEKFSVNQVAEEVLAPLRHQIASSARKIDIQYSGAGEYLIVSDRELFARVLFNIVVNAIRYTPAGEKITVRFDRKENGEFKTAVHNPGSYVEGNHREDIFDKFASVYLTRQGSGTGNYGLGLTFCKMAVEAMGGRIWVESEADTPSATFCFVVRQDGSIE
jgi:K+-sensing histidine kinase KdpD